MSYPLCYTNHMMKMKNEENPNGFKKDLHEWLAEMKAKQEASRKREEVEAYWNAPLDQKDRDQETIMKKDITWKSFRAYVNSNRTKRVFTVIYIALIYNYFFQEAQGDAVEIGFDPQRAGHHKTRRIIP